FGLRAVAQTLQVKHTRNRFVFKGQRMIIAAIVADALAGVTLASRGDLPRRDRHRMKIELWEKLAAKTRDGPHATSQIRHTATLPIGQPQVLEDKSVHFFEHGTPHQRVQAAT